MASEQTPTAVEGTTFELNAGWVRALRFLNFLQPDSPARLDWATIGFATMGFVLLVVTAYVAFVQPGQYAAILAALGGLVPFLINTLHQRMHCAKDDH